MAWLGSREEVKENRDVEIVYQARVSRSESTVAVIAVVGGVDGMR
jgi:hypothetical protein